jgi:uncharacterized NAD-dependent epimerase/dehydratase family protein
MKRYLALAEGYSGDDHYGKTTYGVIRYGSDPVVAVLDSGRVGETVEGAPVVGTVADALAYEPTTALVGVAVAGGRLPPVWRGILRDAIEAGLDVEAGMHEFLADDPELSALAAQHGVELRDYRKPPADLSVPTGENLTHAAGVVLTVGSDCAVGKKTVAVELDRAARARGIRSVFVPTGQTGIMIEGWGIAVDAVVSDFLAGAAERLVVEGSKRGDLLFVEGQGAILHPQFSGVTLGLYHARARPRAPGGRRRDRGCSRPPDPAAVSARLALRAARAARATGARRGHRGEHGTALGRRGAGGRRRDRRGDRPAGLRSCPFWP